MGNLNISGHMRRRRVLPLWSHPRHKPAFCRTAPAIALFQSRRLGLNQNGLVILQIFFDGGYAAAGIGDPEGVRFAQFVMHQQFANHSNPEMGFRHVPDLTRFQGLWATAAARFALSHVVSLHRNSPLNQLNRKLIGEQEV
jgi:hypothetical protein